MQSEYGAWKADGVRRAGVSSFGVGGTNAHVVVEEAPPVPAREIRPGPQVLLLSARTADGLTRIAVRTGRASCPALTCPDLSDVAFTLERRRSREASGWRPSSHDREQAVRVLEAAEHDNVFVGEVRIDSLRRRRIGLPGGFPVPGAGRATRRNGPRALRLRAGVRRAFRLVRCRDSPTSSASTCAPRYSTDRAPNLARTDHAQPALFAVEYALAALIDSYGVHPSALAGHSIGEYVAATLAGVFDLPTAITAVSARARLMHAAPPGAMVAVALAPRRHRRAPVTRPRHRRDQRSGQLRGLRIRGQRAGVRGSACRAWVARSPDADIARIPFEFDGSRAAGIRTRSSRG